SFFDQAGNAISDYPCFSRPGPGQNQHRPMDGFHRQPLLRIQRVQIEHRAAQFKRTQSPCKHRSALEWQTKRDKIKCDRIVSITPKSCREVILVQSLASAHLRPLLPVSWLATPGGPHIPEAVATPAARDLPRAHSS